jgi:hypothetical protein
MGSAGMKRRGRKHLRKVEGHYDRGGGVTHFDNTPWGPINVMDGGRDAPTAPLSAKTRMVLWAILAAVILIAIVVVLTTL